MPWIDVATLEHQVREIVQELLQKQANQWGGTIRRDPNLWTADCLVEGGISLSIQGEGMATRAKRFAEGKFANPPHPKDGYPLSKCKDPRARRMLEFVVPFLYPEKSARVTITVGNTIFGAFTGEREVDWALVIRDIVRRLLNGVGKSKLCPSIPTYYTCISLMMWFRQKTRGFTW